MADDAPRRSSADAATDEDLLARYASGDTTAFADLVRRHESSVYNFVLRQVRTPAVAEDIVQDVFIRIVQGAGDFKGQSRFLTWCFTIARNLCIDHGRKAALRRHPSLDQPSPDGDEGIGATLGERTADPHPRASVCAGDCGTGRAGDAAR